MARNTIGILFSLCVLTGLIFLGGCAAPKTTTGKTQTSKYSEDLSVWHPKAEIEDETVAPTATDGRKETAYIEPKFAVNKQVDIVLDSIDRINISERYLDGFTIQVYSGQNREQALNIKKQLTSSLSTIPSEVHYAQPNFRVKAGKYYTRLSAQKDYLSVKRYFPAAVIVPEKLPIR